EHPTDVDAAADELGAGRLDVRDDQPRSRTEGGTAVVTPLPEMDGTLRAGRCQLHHAVAITADEVGVHSPRQALVEALGAIDVRHGNHHHLELQVLHFTLPARPAPTSARWM